MKDAIFRKKRKKVRRWQYQATVASIRTAVVARRREEAHSIHHRQRSEGGGP
jgi:hypothetical protein